jgi:hypothetical protein
VKPMPVAATDAAVLSIVKVRVLMPPPMIVPGPKAFASAGGWSPTVNEAVAVPLDPAADVNSPVVFTCTPAALLVTSTLTVHELPAATVPPLYVITPDPETAVSVPPVHVVEAFAGAATSIPAGRLSVKLRPVAARALAELSIVKVSVLTPPKRIEFGAKLFEKSGGGSIDRVAAAGVPKGFPPEKRALVVLG